jgi:hypothetical protein
MPAISVDHYYPRLLRKSERTTLVIPAQYGGYVHLLLWTWLGAWAIMEAALFMGLLGVLRGTTPNPMTSAAVLATLLAVFTLAGVFVAWRLLWVSRGREIVDFSPTRLSVRREPGYAKPMEFDRSLIRDLKVGVYSDEAIYPSWGRRFVGKESAFISFRYGDHTHQIGRGLSTRDAEYVLGLIRRPEVP